MEGAVGAGLLLAARVPAVWVCCTILGWTIGGGSGVAAGVDCGIETSGEALATGGALAVDSAPWSAGVTDDWDGCACAVDAGAPPPGAFCSVRRNKATTTPPMTIATNATTMSSKRSKLMTPAGSRGAGEPCAGAGAGDFAAGP